MPRERIEDTEEQKQKTIEMQKKYGIGTFKGFPFLLPERLRKLQEQIEQSKSVEETEIKDESDLRIVVEHIKRKRELLDGIEHELLKLQFVESSWVNIRESLSELSLLTKEIAVFFTKNDEGFWRVSFASVEDGKIKPWKTTVVFPESPFKPQSTGIPKKKRKR